MIERLIFKALSAGVAEFQQNPDLLVRFFRDVRKLEEEEVAGILKLFQARPPSIIHHYAREDSQFPLWSIILVGSNETTKALSDEGGMVGESDELDDIIGGPLDSDDPEAGSIALSSVYTHNFGVLTYADHPDVCLYYSHMAKYFMTRARPFFVKSGLLDTGFSEADMAPDPRYIPAHLFVRQFSMQCMEEERVVGPKQEGLAFKVQGIHIDDGSGKDFGVPVNVTVAGV